MEGDFDKETNPERVSTIKRVEPGERRQVQLIERNETRTADLIEQQVALKAA